MIDSGIDLGHLDFAGRADTSSAQRADDGVLADLDEYHGTLVSSTAAAPTNGVGAEGVYPQAVLRVYDGPDEPTSTAVVRGIEAALAAGPSIINVSLGGRYRRAPRPEAILGRFAPARWSSRAGNAYAERQPARVPGRLPARADRGAVDRPLRSAGFSSSERASTWPRPASTSRSRDPTRRGRPAR